jgi:hypothetical protein
LCQAALCRGKSRSGEFEMMSKEKAKKEKPIDPEQLVDEAIEETFPASDPISPGVGPGEPIKESGDKTRKPNPSGKK